MFSISFLNYVIAQNLSPFLIHCTVGTILGLFYMSLGEEELFLTTCSEEEEKVEKEMDQHKPENTSSDNNQNKAIAKENIIKLASSSCSSIQASKSNVYLENKMRIDKSNTNKNDDSSSMSGHVSRAHFINLMKLNEVNSADDVSSKLSPCKSRIPWQNISQLPAIQSMTSYLMKTCHNYRQTMKAVISSKQSCDDPGSSKMTKLIFKDIHSQTDDQQVSFKIHEAHSKKKYETRNNSVTFHDYKDVGKVDKAVGDGSVKRRGFSFGTGDGMSALSMSAGPSPLKRKRGRPPKAGPSKKFKCNCTDGFYIGKLSNVCRHQAGDC